MHAFRLTPPIEWRQAGSWKTVYELHSAGEPVGTLRARSTWSSEMVFTTRDHEWSFAKKGFWKTRVFVRAAGAAQDLAVFTPDTWTSGGQLDFGPGRHFRLDAHAWRSEMTLKSGDSPTPIVTVKTGGFFKTRGAVTLHPSVENHPDAALLVAFTFYRLIDTQRNAAVAVAAT